MTFFLKPPSGNSLLNYLSYLKPKSVSDIKDTFGKGLSITNDKSNESDDPVYDFMGVTTKDFVEIALNNPKMWTNEEMDLLATAYNKNTNVDQLLGLAVKFLQEEKEAEKGPSLREEPNEPKIEMGRFFGKEESSAPPIVIDIDSIPLAGDSVDDWWKK